MLELGCICIESNGPKVGKGVVRTVLGDGLHVSYGTVHLSHLVKESQALRIIIQNGILDKKFANMSRLNKQVLTTRKTRVRNRTKQNKQVFVKENVEVLEEVERTGKCSDLERLG